MIDADRTRVLWAPLDNASEIAELTSGTALGSLAWDRTGLVWAVDRVPGGSRIVVATPGGTPAEVPVPPLLAGREIVDLAVSPEEPGRFGHGGDLMVGIILRDPDQATASIEGLRQVQIDDREVTSVAWSGLTELAILVQRENEAAEPYRVGIGGSDLSPAGPVPNPVDIAAAPGEGLAVSTHDGTLRRQSPTLQWIDIGPAVSPAYPG